MKCSVNRLRIDRFYRSVTVIPGLSVGRMLFVSSKMNGSIIAEVFVQAA